LITPKVFSGDMCEAVHRKYHLTAHNDRISKMDYVNKIGMVAKRVGRGDDLFNG
jgi:hypothetical protein